ncbi:tail fibers [Aeromonas phage 3]|nr:tail fibers [Aeromonas phage 3]
MLEKITILGAKAPVWANHEKTAINLKVRLSHLPKLEIKFTATPDDGQEHGRELFVRASHGEYGTISPCTAPTDEEVAAKLYPTVKRVELEKLEAELAPLLRAIKFGMATPEEKAKAEALERYTVEVMRSEGPTLPTRV